VRYVHGHDGFLSAHSHIINLDNNNGKFSRAQIAEDPDIHAYLAESNVDEKSLILSGWKLNPQHDLAMIDLEYSQSKRNTQTTRLVVGSLMVLGLGVGALIGTALISTGIFAIIGVAILGGVIAAGIGTGLAKMTEPPPINTLEGKAQQDLNTTYENL
ncbi:MAG: hypothetical protein M1287_00650, partial [Firmicutes bacterium]|nr:hypothetical protein [Bacillota bacterium]